MRKEPLTERVREGKHERLDLNGVGHVSCCLAHAVLVFAVLLFSASVSAQADRNIVFIAIDDLRVDAQAITPNLDTLAQQATVYSQAYTTALYCLPSRTTTMFGISPANHRVGLTQIFFNENTPEYQAIYGNPAILSLPEILGTNGYTTAVSGKVFHTPQPARWSLNGPAVPWSYLNTLPFLGPMAGLVNRGVFPANETHPDQAIADYAVNFIANHGIQDGPFFLGVGFFQPHLPWVAPQWAYDMYNGVTVTAHTPTPGDLDDEPPVAVKSYTQQLLSPGTPQETTLHQLIVDNAEEVNLTRAYLAAASHTDAMIGLVLSALAASPHASNTDVIIWSDHGYQLGEKFRWAKLSYHQPTVLVPLLIKSPMIPAGDVSQPVSLLDLAPTVLDLATGGTHPQFEGVSLRVGSSPVKIHHQYGEAVITGSDKTIDYDTRIPGNNDRAAYDLASDPLELINLVPPGC